MIMKNLRQRLGTGIVLAVAGLAAVCGGCAETQPVYRTPQQIQQEDQELQKAAGLAGSLLFGIAGAGAFDSASRTAQQNLAVRGAAAGAQYQTRNDAIKNSGQGNGNDNQRNTSAKGWVRPNDSFVCRSAKDFNGDGYIGGNELIEPGNYFKCGKEYTKDNKMQIIIGSVWENVKGQNILANIKKASDGKIFHSKEIIAPNNAMMKWDGMNFYNAEVDEGVEEWKVDFYVNGRLDSSKSMSFFIDYGQKQPKN